MTRDFGRTPARSRSVFETSVGLALALVVPLLATTVVDAPAPAGVAVLALALSILVAFGSRSTVLAGRAVAQRSARSTDASPRRSGEVTDPRRHPLRPRAPGQA